jgi:hypothetical protein
MADDETVALTEAMLASGRRLELSHLKARRVDKHSVGGVGDKVSIVLAPLVASCGVAVPMISGRGLGHTGGTLDKLEAIPGFHTRLSLSQAAAQVERIGCVLIGQTGEIAPADRTLYAMRDATATVVDSVEHHEQKARRRLERTRARREDRRGSISSDARRRPDAREHDDCARRASRLPCGGAADRHGLAAGHRVRQRQ